MKVGDRIKITSNHGCEKFFNVGDTAIILEELIRDCVWLADFTGNKRVVHRGLWSVVRDKFILDTPAIEIRPDVGEEDILS